MVENAKDQKQAEKDDLAAHRREIARMEKIREKHMQTAIKAVSEATKQMEAVRRFRDLLLPSKRNVELNGGMAELIRTYRKLP